MAQQSTPPPTLPNSTVPPSTAPASRIMSTRVGDVINLLLALNNAGLEVVRTPDGVDHASGLENLAMGELILILQIMGIHVKGNRATAAPPPPSDSRDPLVQEIEQMVISSARRQAINLFFRLTNGPLTVPPVILEELSSTVAPPPSSVEPQATVTDPALLPPKSQSASDTVMPKGFVCMSCNTYNPIRPSEKPVYVVFCGTDVGVFDHWKDAQSLVSGISHACHCRYNSREEGERAFQAALTAGKVRILGNPIAAPGAIVSSLSPNAPNGTSGSSSEASSSSD
ncbi:hypothetical protein JR316_0004535 [Psilocybe cubensis]|uniref:Uncharacterized protein n=7 Tax=Psilocybe cubensis TaxID=181762 RepID=A0ACB8H5G3_PSICU|nr:hypothetical protein JR316_0011697 [Psilocybe cubensis]XP_047744961.1 hypothetical protein JR316_0009541 [Psilocybe cubensis]XP_047746531.1 hypothetical protein JR316_0009368 [Psilocybe cubensis]XP_047747590.1 hypothetical protein JR316_0008562 [Psilocybe cubensis]XP_047750060.1 hypothetical protein JR316_0004535 [Psilocybe cubensis]KAH9476126.1 hypothetical protein JR316_0011697 [Psilocybe cubensis]KAH9477336.1 hypothetical protein JR316_0009541 [Psilocybe cubensis]KAH9478906.1 hypotheti